MASIGGDLVDAQGSEGIGDTPFAQGGHGMQLQQVLGDYQLGPYDLKTSPRMIMLAVKK